MIIVVKPRRVSFVILLLLLFVLLSLRFTLAENTPGEKIKDFYTARLTELQQKIVVLSKACSEHTSVTGLQQGFKEARLLYKTTSFLIEYINPYQARNLNGPALPRSEEDHPNSIIAPQGFQALEEILFKPWEKDSYEKASHQLKIIADLITTLLEASDLQYRFTDQPNFAAIRLGFIRIATLDIEGFDSPVAFHSLPETMATLDGIRFCIEQYEPLINAENRQLYITILRQIEDSKEYIHQHNSFDQFDRLTFLKAKFDPLFSAFTRLRDRTGIGYAEGLMPVRQQATSLFDIDLFNPDFFSPNEKYRVTDERVDLGRRLFFDPILSGNKKRSCATCHLPEKAFTDGLPKAMAIDEKSFLARNTPTLLNTTFQTRQFFDSRTTTLENQLNDVVHNTREMQGTLSNNISELRSNKQYSALFNKAYTGVKDTINPYTIANAIASYIRSLVTYNTRFDLYMRGDETKLNEIEKKGFNLFAGKAKCATCHFIPLFNGLVPPTFTETESEVLGVPKNRSKRSAVLDDDLGKFNFTKSEIHKHSFKTPTLRNVELTAPYMHNGIFKTLDEVVAFYKKGGGKGLHIDPANQTLPFDKLSLTTKEEKAIVAFMRTLTDTVVFRR